ncbi:MAG: methyltransferase domain-containing protein [Planctomycetes bacterium]|nr:methyltransferase domain-containing protein [Planctomycetota bacterium]
MAQVDAREDARPSRYPLRVHRVDMAGGSLRLVAPRSGLALLQRSPARVAAAARGDHPHWAELWPASIALARRLARGPRLDGLRVWDVGCGLGLAGLAAGRRGAGVVLADRSEEALAFAAHNARAAGLDDVEVRRFDWSRDRLDGRCDLLLLADVGYRFAHGGDLVRLVDGALAAGGGVLCADPGRAAANDLFRELGARGARTERASVLLDGETSDVRIAVLGGMA